MPPFIPPVPFKDFLMEMEEKGYKLQRIRPPNRILSHPDWPWVCVPVQDANVPGQIVENVRRLIEELEAGGE